MNESVGGPIGELLNYITQNREEDKCNFFCSKSEIVFIGIVAITVKLLYHERISIEKEQIEREWVKDFFKNIEYGNEKSCCIETIMHYAKESRYSYEECLRQLYEIFEEDKKLLLNIIEFLIYVKLSNNFYEEDERFILKCIKIFNIDKNEYEEAKKHFIITENRAKEYNEKMEYYNSGKGFSENFPEGLKKYILKKFTEETAVW